MNLFLLLIIIGMAACSGIPQSTVYQQKYFPEGVNDIYLGMTLQYLEKTRTTTTLEQLESTDSTLLAFKEVRPGNEFESLTYYLSNSENQILYELSIDYPLNVDTYQKALEMYGTSNSDEGEWFFETPEGFGLVLWQEENKIFISARELKESPN